MSDTAPTSPAETRRRMPRWLWALLIGSLAVNLLIVGAVAGFAWRHGGWGGGPGFFFGGRILRDLPDDKRAEVKALLDARRSEIEGAWRGVGEAREQAMRVFAAEPFDRAAFESALRQMSEKELAARDGMLRMMGEIGAKLSAEERRRAIKSLKRGWWGRHHGPRGHGAGGL